VLVISVESEMVLLQANRDRLTVLSRVRLFEGMEIEVWSHPALLGNRMYTLKGNKFPRLARRGGVNYCFKVTTCGTSCPRTRRGGGNFNREHYTFGT